MRFLFDDESFSFETLRTAGFALYGGEHTHAGALGRAHPVMFDWLDATLASCRPAESGKRHSLVRGYVLERYGDAGR